MTRVLFVDDEQRVLDGLQRLLRPQRHSWDMKFALGAVGAHAELQSAHFDVIVTDMRMPATDGAALLREVRQRYPHMARIILSGHTEVEAAIRAAQVAHQYLSKPCDPEILKEAVNRVSGLQAMLADEPLRSVVGSMGGLPSSPRLIQEVTRVIADSDASVSELAQMIGQDVAMCAKCLQLVNSAFFGLPRRITCVREAVAYLGTDLIRNLVCLHEVFQTFDSKSKVGQFDPDELDRHALLTASIAARIVNDKHQAQDAFVAGMLHDVGKLILATRMRERFAEITTQAATENRPLETVEQEALGVTHAEVGAYLLGLWGLPYAIVESVAYHHRPDRMNPNRFGVAASIYVASLLARHYGSPHDTVAISAPEFDMGFLASMGVADRLPAWQALASELVAEPAGC